MNGSEEGVEIVSAPIKWHVLHNKGIFQCNTY